MLPIESALPELLRALTIDRSAVLVAPPGAGKTTRVPLALLDAAWLGGQKILMLEPRRLAARAAASRMAKMLGEQVGQTVGYQIRMDRRIGGATRIVVVTEGILTRMLQDDPSLEGIGIVIFDEFHERSAIADSGLALTLATREMLRDELRILVMSATLDGAAVARLLGDAPVIRSEGQAFPVKTTHHAVPSGQRVEAHVASLVRDALMQEKGSILVFLAGAGEIRRVETLLAQSILPDNVTVYPLHGSLAMQQQDNAINTPGAGQRKVVLATNIAETSLTIEGIRVVIDSGWSRVPRFSPRTGMTRLETVRVTRASADQRRGRAGRLEQGSCWRCWSLAEEAGLIPFARPELLEADLAPLALDLAAAGFADPGELKWLDPPPAAAFAQARELLQLLGALDAAGRLTAHGGELAALGTHPRYGHMLINARHLGVATTARAAAIVALLEERDLLRGDGAAPPSDFRLRLDVVERNSDTVMMGSASVDRGILSRVRDGAAEWRRRIGASADSLRDETEDVGLILAWGFPDRVAQRRGAAGKFVLRNGRGAWLPSEDALAHVDWLVVPQLDDTGRDARIIVAAPLALDQLLDHAREQVSVVDEIKWDDATESVAGRRRTMLGALTVSEGGLPQIDVEQQLAALLQGIRSRGLERLPWSKELRSWRQRINFLHRIDPRWPDLGDAELLATLELWLAPHLTGVRRLDGITAESFRSALHAMMPPALRKSFDDLAPERITVPTGSQIAVDYSDPDRPMLGVRLQELFGLQQTPRIGGGKVAVTMQLLSPGYQPVQLTQDLASFWRNGYFDVRKDLRGRYPRHHWPEDPTTAVAVRGPKKRGS